uniref:Uncharacterized protein n=1 Tax=Arundo donax TaxID=35708 RepID=A0A0A9CH00_ARUDO
MATNEELAIEIQIQGRRIIRPYRCIIRPVELLQVKSSEMFLYFIRQPPHLT